MPSEGRSCWAHSWLVASSPPGDARVYLCPDRGRLHPRVEHQRVAQHHEADPDEQRQGPEPPPDEALNIHQHVESHKHGKREEGHPQDSLVSGGVLGRAHIHRNAIAFPSEMRRPLQEACQARLSSLP